MQVTVLSILSNKRNTMDIQVSRQQLQAWMNGADLDTIMPDLTDDQKSFITTGVTPKEWDAMFS